MNHKIDKNYSNRKYNNKQLQLKLTYNIEIKENHESDLVKRSKWEDLRGALGEKEVISYAGRG